jgi:HSP20 family molecular chaperone IbpA
MLPSIFGESLFDDWMGFPFDRNFEKEFEKDFFPTKNPLYGKNAKNLMKTDVRDMDDHYEVDVDLPGFKKEDVSAELKDGYITISASKGLDKEKTDKKTGRYIRQERYVGNLSRSFYVGEDITQEEVHAKFEDGILQLTIPKKDKQAIEATNRIAIE